MYPLLTAAGVFTLALGVFHFFIPLALDYEHAIPREGPPLRLFRLLFYRYQTLRSDVRGIAWFTNHLMSYVLVTVGLLDLLASRWLPHAGGPWLAAWIAGWWFLRAGGQLYLGRRRGDWLVLAWFSALGIVHLLAAWSSIA